MLHWNKGINLKLRQDIIIEEMVLSTKVQDSILIWFHALWSTTNQFLISMGKI